MSKENSYLPPSRVDLGHVADGRITFDPWRSPADTPAPPPPVPLPPSERVGFAVVALGRLSLEEILPAFAQTRKAKLVALVSGTPDKLKLVAHQYGIPPENCFSYETFDAIRDRPDIQAVYIVLPNSMHRDFVERTASAGKHVICEKPLATSVSDAKAMIEACAQEKVKLMVAYRIHYEPYNRKIAEIVRLGYYGKLVALTASNTQTVAENGAEQWRHKAAMAGGGALPDIGIYCLNTARFITAEEPSDLWATQYSPADDPRFAEVEQTVSFTLRFPSNVIANCLTSYGAREDKHLRLHFERATLDLMNAFAYRGQRLTVVERQGEHTAHVQPILPVKNQFAEEIDHMATCVLEDHTPQTSGDEGLRDQILIDVIYQSARTGLPIKLD